MGKTAKAAASPGCDEWHGIGAEDRDRLDGLVGGLPGSVVYRLIMDPQGTPSLAYVSPAITDNFGLTRDQVMDDVGLWYALIHPGDVERVMATQRDAFDAGEPFRTTSRYVLPGGEERLFEVHSSPKVQTDGCVVWNGVATDVTEAARIRAERQRLLDLVEATPDMVTLTATDGRVEYANRAARSLGAPDGRQLDELTVHDIHPPETIERFAAEAVPSLTEDGIWTGKATVLTGSGEVPVSTVIVAARDAEGEVTHYSSIARDLREEEATAARLAQASERVETALREVNHRIKNVFALVPALVKLSARTANSVEDLSEAVQARIGALARSHTVTLNAFSGGDGIALGALIEAVLEPYDKAADVFEQDGPPVRLSGRTGNAVALALHELATNAAKHGVLSQEGGSVRIAWDTPLATARDGEDETVGLKIVWTEDGGPPVEGPPAKSGFGTSLLDRLIAAQGGRIERDWRREGLRVTMSLPQL